MIKIKFQFVFCATPILFFRFLNKQIQKIEFHPQKDQKNATSKNDAKSRLGALNEKL